MASGVYCIENIASGRRYIGSAVDIHKRWKEHRRQLRDGHHHSKFMQRCWNKYGEAAFAFRILLFCAREHVLMYEQTLLDAWKPEYNTSPTAGSQLGYRHSEETRSKLSDAAKRTKNFTGCRHSEESKARISESRKGKGLGPQSEERRRKIGAAHKGKVIPQEMRDRISKKLSGTSTGRGVLNEDQVREIRRLWRDGLRKCEIARELGLNKSWVNTVVDGHGYGWVI